MNEYNFSEIESKWQKIWKDNNYGQSKDFDEKPKHYHLVEFPYPSGAGLHVGHCMGYGASDAYCRMKRMQGFNVMFPIGWDAFGLPTENYAIKNHIQPSVATENNIKVFKDQIESLGYAFDWPREVNTTDPNYYKWTQWIFLQFYKHSYKHGKLVEVKDDDKITPRMAYQAEMPVNWCPSCKIVLANEEVIAGACERCGTVVEKRMQKQWMLRITAYADRLIDDLEKVDFPAQVKTQQINWIDRSEGAKIKFPIAVVGSPSTVSDFIEVFTTRADTLFGCTYVVLAPENPLIEHWKLSIDNYADVAEYIKNTKEKTDIDRTDLNKDKTGIKLEGLQAVNPINNEKVDIYIADYVLLNYGTGAVMAVPAHDERDYEFAKKYNIPIKTVIQNANLKMQNDNLKSKNDYAFTDYGILINSNDFNDLTSDDAKKKITQKLKENGVGDFSTNYKLRDWIFSRQHYWGEPIPIIHCDKCGTIPLDEKDLPLELPPVENYEPTETGESPLAVIDSWVNIKCPKCGGPAKRETDTMPNWAGSSWYYLRYCDPNNNNNMTDMDKLKYWTPVDIYNGGTEHITLHLLYSRFWHKFLFDIDKVPSFEPYQKRVTHGIILGPDGQKMSKSKGNVINPDDIVKQFGADTLRAYIMFIGPYDQESAWSMAGIQGVYRFLKRVWLNKDKVTDNNDGEELLVKLNQTIKSVSSDIENFQMNTVISKLMELNNLIEKVGSISKSSYQKYLTLLYPASPHISAELWSKLQFDGKIENQSWPKADDKYLVASKITIVIQVNGKVRDKIEVASSAGEKEIIEIAKNTPKMKEIIGNNNIKKSIYITGRIVNFVLR